MYLVVLSASLSKDELVEVKQAGFSDRQLGMLMNSDENTMRNYRVDSGVKPWVKQASSHVINVSEPFHSIALFS